MAAPRLRGGRLRGGKGGNPQPIGGERKVQLIMFTYLHKPGLWGFLGQEAAIAKRNRVSVVDIPSYTKSGSPRLTTIIP